MTRRLSDSQRVVVAIRELGMNGAFLKSEIWAKSVGLAKVMIGNIPGGADEIIRVAKYGMPHIWPFSEGNSWDIFDLWKHYSPANAEANKRALDPESVDLDEQLGQPNLDLGI